MVNHCIEVRHRETFAKKLNNFCFFIKILQLNREKTCSHYVIMRTALNESEVDPF